MYRIPVLTTKSLLLSGQNFLWLNRIFKSYNLKFYSKTKEDGFGDILIHLTYRIKKNISLIILSFLHVSAYFPEKAY